MIGPPRVDQGRCRSPQGYEEAPRKDVLLEKKWSDYIEFTDILAQFVQCLLLANLDDYHTPIVKVDDAVTLYPG
jgi:hypothetical protein